MSLLRVQMLPERIVATLTTGSLGEPNDEAVGQELSDLALRLGDRSLELDLAAVEYLTSMGLAKLIALHKQLRAAGSRLTLRNVRADAYEVFKVCRLTGLLDVRRASQGGAPLSESA